jgi:hypothetical protein
MFHARGHLLRLRREVHPHVGCPRDRDDAVRDGRPGDLHAAPEVGCSVVEPRQDVGVEVDEPVAQNAHGTRC